MLVKTTSKSGTFQAASTPLCEVSQALELDAVACGLLGRTRPKGGGLLGPMILSQQTNMPRKHVWYENQEKSKTCIVSSHVNWRVAIGQHALICVLTFLAIFP